MAQTVRQKIRAAVAKVMVNSNNWPIQISPHLLGRDMSRQIDLVTDEVVKALEPSKAYWEAMYFGTGMHPSKIQFHTEAEAIAWWDKNVNDPHKGVSELVKLETVRSKW